MKALTLPPFVLFFCLFHFSFPVYSSHMRAAEITVRGVSCDDLTVEITVTAYMNSSSGVQFGGHRGAGEEDRLTFGDGQLVLIPETPTTPRPDLGIDVGIARFTVIHTYSGPGCYEITYTEQSRNEGVLNMSNSVTTRLFVSTVICVDAFSCNNYPEILIPPVDRACSGVAFFHNPGAFDPDGDSLSYELGVPAGNNGQPVSNYRSPADPAFYVPGPPMNEEGNGLAIFTIDPLTGLLSWDAPGTAGEYNIAIRIVEWRKHPETGEPMMLSSTIRDMQIMVEDCDNERPDLIIPKDTCIEAGGVLDLTIYGTDPENHSVKIEAFSELFELASEDVPATYSPNPPDFVPSNPPAELTFQWNTNCLHVRKHPYQVVFKITDEPPSGPKLVTYKTWTITVVAPKPEWINLEPDLVNRYALLSWNAYDCSNAEAIQIWRRVDQFSYSPGDCEPSTPQKLGYELIEEVDSQTIQYTDTGHGRRLSVGAKYCYRIVARMSSGNFSVMSDELCMDPIMVDAPVITHVTVEKTDYQNGSIRISWRSPFEINKSQYPEPYQYEIYRGEGLDHAEPRTAIGRVNDTTYLDVNINTEEKAYHYTVVLYSRTQNNPSYSAVDTSATASSIRLTTSPGAKSVRLEWTANVPWSNHSQRFQRHLIYRGEYGTPESDLTLIDSIDVTVDGLMYVDEGKYVNKPLDDNTLYCYKVMTRGVYGNPAMDEPLENISPLMCSYPINDLPTCSPTISVIKPDCDQFLSTPTCGPYDLSNTIFWEPPTDQGCRIDIKSYAVYAAKFPEGEYEMIADNVRDPFFIEEHLVSQARCYRVRTIDRLGRESEFSEPVCNDNCIYYELPNVFTPNGDGCNDLFSAFYQPEGETGEEISCKVVFDDLRRCPRFVNRVYFKVYNRWGQKIYHHKYEDSSSVRINWDGKDSNGVDLPSAIYYYVAEVEYDAIDPSKKSQRINGWVHLIR